MANEYERRLQNILGTGSYGGVSKRKPIKHGTRTNILADSGAKCQKCGNPLKGLKPHIHHKNGNPRDNKLSNLILLCPNCHSKLHRQMKPIKKGTKTSSYPFGIKPIKMQKFRF